ncbi:hypothetical protein TRFO_22833 [Tritrichomonas foetus]|uniref:Exportin-1 C-terminal domain-containing protein n=1 Tax=Tritrichomonas foetus TaxID=1144522 RepID=A0A1J4KAY4_9EUKA|nr:hypothetical protein TRFO_22833 [Tritrichomonas foetus]|eukprot:OHT08577.1 hypothetical protein TRFO_22833 [Tritrichomonas foetus]
MGNVGTYARSLTDEALIKIMKLCTFIACKLNMPLDPIISAILYTLQHRPETAIRAMSEMAIAASEKCCLLFESLWEPLFELLNVTDEFTELIFLALTSAIANCRIDDITEPFNYFLEFIKDNTELSSLTFELFAVCRLNRPEFEDYAPILESLVKKSEISAGMFKFLTSFSITSLNVNLILSSIVAGTTPDIHKEALNCARNLLLSLAENALLTKLISKVRPVLINSVVQSLMDARHQLGFSRQASFLNEAFRLGELQEDQNYIKEFYASLIACSPEPEQGLFQHVAAHLDHIKENKVDFKESLRDFLLIMRKATPYQIGTFFGDDQQEEETATFGELLEEEEQVRKSIVMSTNALPQIQ